MAGRHNDNLPQTIQRLHRGGTYKDQTTAIVVPSRNDIPVQIASSWFGLMRPMNQVCAGPFFFDGYEVGDAYNNAVEFILECNRQAKANKSKPFRYMMTLETDNQPEPDALLKLLENIERYDCIGGLYFTKGEGGQPMIYGSPKEFPKNFAPQPPIDNTLQEANGLGMGCNLFKVSLFERMAADLPKNERGVRQWFQTKQTYERGKGCSVYTQDLAFFESAAKYGGRFACDTRVKVGHLDFSTGILW